LQIKNKKGAIDMKLKYYGIGIGLIIAISCITLTFINLNTSNNKIENKSEVVATSSEQVYSPNNKQNIDDEKIQPSTKSNDSTVLELEPPTKNDYSKSLKPLPIPDSKDVGDVDDLS
jgi:Na+-translocating ferredoxin:NAD+ oxidoreductase RnfG subunit